MEDHWRQRRGLADLGTRLEERAAQWRSIQKRLLVRFKVRSGEQNGGWEAGRESRDGHNITAWRSSN